eukprot:CAMPEP_0172641160 /NCGR_PEP_ID=MMETSP1068-20121228/226010_1 /TAXON_ID=35684 /ORGANISM="Pseudopedinella elastica, Strain CCMP716" /LENGTH=105 /DNA_ID=CAMNT_0013454673 /DNA_START=13 /DNA_END=327 /DNA_ORIENTATION=-
MTLAGDGPTPDEPCSAEFSPAEQIANRSRRSRSNPQSPPVPPPATIPKEELLKSGSEEASAKFSEHVASFPSDWAQGLDSSLLGAFCDDATSEHGGVADTADEQD